MGKQDQEEPFSEYFCRKIPRVLQFIFLAVKLTGVTRTRSYFRRRHPWPKRQESNVFVYFPSSFFFFTKVFIFSYSYPFSSSFLLFTLPRRFNDFLRLVAILFSRKKTFDSRFNTFEIQMQLNKSMHFMVKLYTPFSHCFTFVQYRFADRFSSIDDRVI